MPMLALFTAIEGYQAAGARIVDRNALYRTLRSKTIGAVSNARRAAALLFTFLHGRSLPRKRWKIIRNARFLSLFATGTGKPKPPAALCL